MRLKKSSIGAQGDWFGRSTQEYSSAGDSMNACIKKEAALMYWVLTPIGFCNILLGHLKALKIQISRLTIPLVARLYVVEYFYLKAQNLA
jgi:hypothetical protein